MTLLTLPNFGSWSQLFLLFIYVRTFCNSHSVIFIIIQNIPVLKVSHCSTFLWLSLSMNFFMKQVLNFFPPIFFSKLVYCEATPLASDEVVTYWACRRVSRTLFIVTSFSVRALRIKFFFQKIENTFGKGVRSLKIVQKSNIIVFKCVRYIFPYE